MLRVVRELDNWIDVGQDAYGRGGLENRPAEPVREDGREQVPMDEACHSKLPGIYADIPVSTLGSGTFTFDRKS